MKKVLSMILTFALVFGLAACTSSESAPAPAAEPEAEPVSAEEQIALMVANKDLWLMGEDNVYPPYYAVTDMDGNGRLELIRCVPGDDWWSTDTFFAVSEDCKELKELPFEYGTDHSHPDLVDQDSYRMYVGQEGRYLIVNDDIYMGPVQASDYCGLHVLDYLLFGEDGVEAGDLAWCRMQDEDTNGDCLKEYHIYYYTGGDEDEELDGEGYVNSVSERFSGYDEQVCTLGWWSLGEDTAPDDDAMTTGLTYSWNDFSIEPDGGQFESLIGDPYYNFYAAGAGGATIYRAGDEVPYFPSFMDVYGTWYLQSAWNDDGITYVGAGLSSGELEILYDGMLYADYSNDNDPRGPYLFTEMKMVEDTKALGTDGDDWCITYENDDGTWQMQLRPDPDNDMMYVTWYEWEDESRSTDPTGMTLVYSRIAG